MAKPIIYLDYAAATPVDPTVLEAMMPYFSQEFYNPSATYLPAKRAHQALDTARVKVAHWLGARPSEVIFTAGGSEANNLAIHGIMRKFPEANIVSSSIEHDSVLMSASRYQHRQVEVSPDGRLSLDDLSNKIDHNTVLVSVAYANSEIGTVQSIRQIAKIIEEKKTDPKRKHPLYFHSDACQAANYLDLHLGRLGVDLLTLNGGKIYGPKQSGVLYVRAGLELIPIIDGGGQERGLRSGTENLAGAVGLATALDLAQQNRQLETTRLKTLQDQFVQIIKKDFVTTSVNGSLKHRLPNNVHLTIEGIDNERLLIELEQSGILAAAGSACSASDDTPSHVLKAIGLTDAQARASIRFSMGRATTSAMMSQTIDSLRTLLK